MRRGLVICGAIMLAGFALWSAPRLGSNVPGQEPKPSYEDFERRVTQFYDLFSNKRFDEVYDMALPSIRSDIGRREEYAGNLVEALGKSDIRYDQTFGLGVTFFKGDRNVAITRRAVALNGKDQSAIDCQEIIWVWYESQWYWSNIISYCIEKDRHFFRN